MLREIKKIDSKKTAKIFSLWMASISLIIAFIGLIVLVYGIIRNNKTFIITSITYLLMPIVYLVASYLLTRLSCWVYNLLAKRINGITIELIDIDND